MAKLTVAGVPIQPMINDLPAALIPMTAAADMIGLVTGDRSWSRTASHTLLLSLITGVAAGTVGAIDYTAVSARGAERKTANTHALLNAGLLGVGLLNLLLRRDRSERPSLFSRLLSVAVVPMVFYSGLQGAVLAYRSRMAEVPFEEVGLGTVCEAPTFPIEGLSVAEFGVV